MLRISSEIEAEKNILSKIEFKANHTDTIALQKELNEVSEKLIYKGYFDNRITKMKLQDSIYTVCFSVGNQIKKAVVFNPKVNKSVEIEIAFLENYMQNISDQLNSEGRSFSEVKLKNIRIENKILFANLVIVESESRRVDRVVVNGYEKFSKSYIRYFLGLKKNSIFNQKKLDVVSRGLNSLDFVSEIKPAEVLFSKDSTLIYMYLKKENSNFFDGLLNFTTKENGKLGFNGCLNLKLKNILHKGELFELRWNANGEQRQDFSVSTHIPFVYNLPITPELNFNIFRQDSTFLNTRFDGKLHYSFNHKTSIALTCASEVSNQVTKNIGIDDFSSFFYGVQFKYRIVANTVFNDDRFFLQVNPLLGVRNHENQFKIDLMSSCLFPVGYRNSIFIRNKTGYLYSHDYLSNELYRIGGVTSIRGFNEGSFFTSKYSYFNLEYRYLISNSSYLYSISDFGKVDSENLIGLGFGYLFFIKNTLVNLNYSLGSSMDGSFIFNQSKVGLQIISKF